MLSLPEIQERLGRACIARAARKTGLAYHTVYRISKGKVTNPNLDTMVRLSDWLTSPSDRET